MFFMKSFAPCVQRLMLRVDRCCVRFEGKQMCLQFFEVHPVIDGTELRGMELLELLDQLGMRRFEFLLRRGEPVGGRFRLLGHSGILPANRCFGLAKPGTFEHR